MCFFLSTRELWWGRVICERWMPRPALHRWSSCLSWVSIHSRWGPSLGTTPVDIAWDWSLCSSHGVSILVSAWISPRRRRCFASTWNSGWRAWCGY